MSACTTSQNGGKNAVFDGSIRDGKPSLDGTTLDGSTTDAAVTECTFGPYLVGTAAPKPDWADAELAAFDAFENAVDAFFDKFADTESGALAVGTYDWGNWDDLMEGEAVFDKFLLVAGRQDQRTRYSQVYKFHHQQAIDRGWLHATHSFYTRLYDAEHADEAFMYLWAALEVTPTDPELRAWNEAIASWLMSAGPFNSDTWVFRSFRLGTNNQAGGEHSDVLLNLVYTYAAIRAWMTSGDDTYRQWVYDYTDAWAAATLDEGEFAGILPFQIHSDTLEPGPLTDGHWWQGAGDNHMKKFDYEDYGFGCLGRSTHGAVVAQQLADPQNPTLAASLASTLDKFVAAGAPGPPTDSYKTENGGFYRRDDGYLRFLPRQFAATHTVLYSPASQALIDAYVAVREHTDVADRERKWINWLAFMFKRGLDPAIPTEQFDIARRDANNAVSQINNLSLTDGQMPSTGDELRLYAPSFAGLDYIDGAMAGKRNRRDGAPSPAPIRYYKADGEMGLPAGVAALVRQQTKDSVEVWLYNDNPQETTVVLLAGHYGQHTFDTLGTVDRDDTQSVACNHVFLTLPAEGLARLELTITRFTHLPTLTPFTDYVAP
jgi:hypothetical protein